LPAERGAVGIQTGDGGFATETMGFLGVSSVTNTRENAAISAGFRDAYAKRH
jgi:hypothetical protein